MSSAREFFFPSQSCLQEDVTSLKFGKLYEYFYNGLQCACAQSLVSREWTKEPLEWNGYFNGFTQHSPIHFTVQIPPISLSHLIFLSSIILSAHIPILSNNPSTPALSTQTHKRNPTPNPNPNPPPPGRLSVRYLAVSLGVIVFSLYRGTITPNPNQRPERPLPGPNSPRDTGIFERYRDNRSVFGSSFRSANPTRYVCTYIRCKPRSCCIVVADVSLDR